MRISDWSSDVCSSDLQWYVDAETLARPAIEAVHSGKIEIVPKSWEKTYYNWMENIQPWCVSRQLWWGHQIPAWYDAEGNVYVSEDEAGAKALADNKPLTRDNDVLDTWRSEEHTSELQSLMRISYAVFCLKKKTITKKLTESLNTNIHRRTKHTIRE